MPHNVSQSQSNASPAPNLTDITVLVSALNDLTQVLLPYCQTLKAHEQEQSGQDIDAVQSREWETKQDSGKHEPQKTMGHFCSNQGENDSIIPRRRSKQEKRQKKREELSQEFCLNHADSTEFSHKDLAQSFEYAYNCGNYQDEIRYYYVPARTVRFEHHLLRKYQQKDTLDLLFSVYKELLNKYKLITSLDNAKNKENLTLSQIRQNMSSLLKLLRSIHDHFIHFTLVHKSVLPQHNK